MTPGQAPVPRDPAGRRDPAAVEMIGLGFASLVRHPVAIVSLLIAEICAGLALSIGITLVPDASVGPSAREVADRFVVTLSPILSVTEQLRPEVMSAGTFSWAQGSPAVGWSVTLVLIAISAALVLAVVSGAVVPPGLADSNADSDSRAWGITAGHLWVAMIQAGGVASLLATPVIVAAVAADRVNRSAWMVPAAVIGLSMVAWWGFRFVADAVVTGRRSASAAVVESVRIVLRFPGVTVRLFVLGECIALGCRPLWIGLVGSPSGLFFALLGNATVLVALTAGRVTFYREAREILDAERADVFTQDALSPGIFAARS